MVKDLLVRVQPESNLLNEMAITGLRVFVGLTMALGHGMAKMPPSELFVQSVSGMGFPFAGFFAWAAAFSEFVGGLFLAAGLLTRPASLAIASTMSVAAFIRHASDPFARQELALLHFVVAIFFMVRGSSRFSIDRFLA